MRHEWVATVIVNGQKIALCYGFSAFDTLENAAKEIHGFGTNEAEIKIERIKR